MASGFVVTRWTSCSADSASAMFHARIAEFGHPLGERVAGDHQDLAALPERLLDAERLNEDVVRGEVARQRVGGLQRLAQQGKQIRVGAHAGGLLDRAGLGQRRQQLDELVDREDPGQRGPRDRDVAGFDRADALLEVELRRVEVAAGGGPADGQREGPCGSALTRVSWERFLYSAARALRSSRKVSRPVSGASTEAIVPWWRW